MISNYWSPNQFIDLSIRLELNHEFHKNKYLGLNLSKGRQQEKGFVWGNSTYINAYLQFGNRNHSHVVLSYERIDSSRENSKWNSNHFKIEFKESF